MSIPVRIAMWSGPRNISTAMMRSWENRPDSCVVDEPFYACYLSETGLAHPCREAILASQSTDRARVVRQLSRDPFPAQVFYQKHMTHHMPRGMDMSWCRELRHCFLVRDPAEIIASYLQKMPSVSEDDIGIVRQAELFDEIGGVCGQAPLLVDARAVLQDPAGVLAALCDRWELPRHAEQMLHWPKGRRDSDGAWASHWYQAVEASTGFAPYRKRVPALHEDHRELAERMDGIYRQLLCHRLAT